MFFFFRGTYFGYNFLQGVTRETIRSTGKVLEVAALDIHQEWMEKQ
jgi:hypothetical protein